MHIQISNRLRISSFGIFHLTTVAKDVGLVNGKVKVKFVGIAGMTPMMRTVEQR